MTFSRNWREQSEAAREEGVCHTFEETKLMYAEIDQEKKDAAIKAFRESDYASHFPEIRDKIAEDPEHWNAESHFLWGMNVRNFFRRKGFGEDYFGVDNLDCIYRELVEFAVKE